MPIYEYRCNHCGHELETIQKISESPLTFCPACETEGLKKKISAAVFRLRGSGWYETDFKSDNKKNVAGDDDGGAKEGGAKEGGAKEKENGKGKAGQGASESGTEKAARGGQSDSKTKEKPKGDSKSPVSGSAAGE